jgi:hypothetical protein
MTGSTNPSGATQIKQMGTPLPLGQPPGGPANATPGKTPEQQVRDDTALGYGMADEYGIGKEGSMGRLNDERKGEMDALLAKQLAGLDGMTPQEMQAAREQGNAGINQQLATNMAQFGDIAAGAGIRGGSAAGLQMQALSEAQSASGSLQRQLILDNMAQKNIAMDRYGNTLQNQQGVGLGIQSSNNQSMNAEQLARHLAAGNFGSQVDSVRSGNAANDLSNRSIDVAQSMVDKVGSTGKSGGTQPSGGRSDQTVESSAQNFQETYGVEGGPQTMVRVGPDGKQTPLSAQEAGQLPTNKFANSKGYDSWQSMPYDMQMSPEGLAALNKQNEDPSIVSKDYADKTPNDNRPTGTNSCIITTEAMEQGLLDEEWKHITREYKLSKMPRDDIAVYWAWAESVVKLMKRSPLAAKTIAKVLPGTLAAMSEDLGYTVYPNGSPLHGKFFFGVYRKLNDFFRPIVLKRNGSRMSPAAVERMMRMKQN